jgi:hypothetical protein
LNRPAWHQFPYQVASRYPSNRNRETVALSDELLAKIDGYMKSLGPVAHEKHDAAVLLGCVQDLQHSVLVLRSTAATGAHGSALARSADRVMSQYQQTSEQVTSLIARDPSLNSPLFYQIGQQVQEIRYVVRGIRT